MKFLIEELLKKKQFSFLNKDFSIAYLNSGTYNTMHVIDVGEKFVIRVNTYQDEFSSPGLDKEFEVLSLLPEGIAPKPYVVDVSKKDFSHPYMIQSFIFGNHPKEFSFKILTKIAQKMSLIHSMGFSKCGPFPGKFNKYSLIRLLKPYFNTINNDESQIIKLIVAAKKYAVYHDKNNPLKKFSLIHYDVHSKNLIYDGKEIYFIDWEFAESGDPAMDIVMLFWYSTLFNQNIGFDKVRRDYFLQEYKRLTKNNEIEKRVKIQEPIVVLIQLLWLKSQIRNWENLPEAIRVNQRKEDYIQGIKIALDFLNKHGFKIYE